MANEVQDAPDEYQNEFSRRDFVKGAAAFTATALANASAALAARKPEKSRSRSGASDAASSGSQIAKRELGKTGAQVSILGVGGYHLGSTKDQQEANELVARSLDAGINFFDNAWDYHDGLSEERLGTALRGKRDQAFVMTKVCTHG
ncbi:MAG: aldo/keto reductase, partial [Candidatus Acidiferrales bacterium]